MMTLSSNRRTATDINWFTAAVVRTACLGAALVGLMGTASAAEAQPASAATAAATAQWERKLDRTLQVAADATPDAAVRVTVRLAANASGTKAQDLASFGFPVNETRDARTLVLTLTGREAMVLAEDPELESFAVDAPAPNVAQSKTTTAAAPSAPDQQ